jgi:hypothetical protein
MSANIPIGIDDFRALREQGLTYVDKTHFICELIDRPGAQVLLLPRPRRFGKSLALSMLRCFFEKRDPAHDLAPLFEDLAVWRSGERYRAHFQRYPVIHLGFKDLDLERWDDVLWAVREKIRDLFDEHRAVLETDALSALERERFGQILAGSAPPGLYQRALFDLSRALHRAHGEKVIVLIDEYDHLQPVHAGHAHGYAPAALGFFRGLLTAGLEGNPHLARAVLTGVVRVARDSIFSGLNNLAVYTVLRSEFSTCFGFTDSEVDALLARTGQPDEQARRDAREVIDRWYGGYRFGEHRIYNPWSVLRFLAEARPRPRPHWLQTSGSDLVRHLLARDAERLRPLLESLLAGESIACVLDENLPLEHLAHSPEALWSLLVFSGYLSAVERPPAGMEPAEHAVSIPNRELRTLYQAIVRDSLRTAPDQGGLAIARLREPRAGAEGEDEAEVPAEVPAAVHIDVEGAAVANRAAAAGAGGRAGSDDRDELVERDERDDLVERATIARQEREQARSPRERRPDILADAAAFEEQLQGFLDEMRAAGAGPAPVADDATRGDDDGASAGAPPDPDAPRADA